MTASTAPEKRRCKATTRSGAPCRNYAVAGSDYCRVHQHLAETAGMEAEQEAPVPAMAEVSPGQEAPIPASEVGTETPTAEVEIPVTPAEEVPAEAAEGEPSPIPVPPDLSPEEAALFRRLSQELNALAAELRRQEPSYTPPPFSVTGLVDLLRTNLYRFTPEAQREIIEQLRSNLAGTRPRDLVDPETWKGFWYVLNYLAQQQAGSTLERLNRRLARIPGFALLSDLREGLKDAKPSDFLDPETWKGLIYIANYSAKLQIQEMKRRILGESAGDEGDEEA